MLFLHVRRRIFAGIVTIFSHTEDCGPPVGKSNLLFKFQQLFKLQIIVQVPIVQVLTQVPNNWHFWTSFLLMCLGGSRLSNQMDSCMQFGWSSWVLANPFLLSRMGFEEWTTGNGSLSTHLSLSLFPSLF